MPRARYLKEELAVGDGGGRGVGAGGGGIRIIRSFSSCFTFFASLSIVASLSPCVAKLRFSFVDSRKN